MTTESKTNNKLILSTSTDSTSTDSTPVILKQSIYTTPDYKNIELLLELLYDERPTNLQDIINNILDNHSFIKDELFDIVLLFLSDYDRNHDTSSSQKIRDTNSSQKIRDFDLINKLKLLDKKNKYIYYLLGYCYYNEYFDGLGSDIGIEIEQCIIYVQMGGALPINCLCAMYYAHSGTTSEHLILSLLELLPNELINKFYKITSLDVFSEQLVSFHQFITKVYINRTNYLQNKVNEMEIKLVNLMHQHEEEIKELLTPGNKGALAAESRFKEIVTVTDKSDGLDSLDE